MIEKFTRTSNVLQFKSPLDRIATLSGPDQAQRACDEVAGQFIADYSPLTDEELSRPNPEMDELLARSKPYRAPESDPA